MEVKNEIDYKDGFNRGYLLYTYEPDIAKSLIKAEIDTRDNFVTGFSEGLLQAQQEKIINEFEQLRNDSNDQQLER